MTSFQTILRNLLAAVAVAHVAAAARAGEATPLVIESVVLRPLAEAEVPARRTGVLLEILATEGAVVDQGALLASLDDRAAALTVQRAELERAQALVKAQNDLSIQFAAKAIEVARAELERSLQSNQKFPNSISQSQLDVERLTVERLDLERRQAEHEQDLQRFELKLKETALAAAKHELELHAIRAPFSGVVALVRARAGEWVEPGVPVLKLVGVDVLRAEGFAPAEASAVAVGAAVRFEVDGGRREEPALAARIGFVSPEIDPVTRQVRIWAAIDNADRRLRPGQRGRLIFSDEE